MLLRKFLLSILLLAVAAGPVVGPAQLGLSIQEVIQEHTLIPDAEAFAGAPAAQVVQDQQSPIQRFFSGVIEIFVILNWIALSGVQALLDPDVIFGNPIPAGQPGAGDRPMELILRNIWVTSRNIVNGIFAFILLFAGIYLIVKSDEDGISKVRQTAPKFILAVVLVNFSWFFPRVILDVSNVMSSVVYQLPSLVNPNFDCIKSVGPDGVINTADDVPCTYVWKVQLFPPTDKECADAAVAGDDLEGCPRPIDDPGEVNYGKRIGNLVDIYYEDWLIAREDGYFDEDGFLHQISGADAVLNGLATNFARLPELAVLDLSALKQNQQKRLGFLENAKELFKFTMKIVFHVVMSLAIGLALIAFMVVLLIRMAVLWMCIGFMPFIFVGFALGRPLGDLGSEGSSFNIWKEFISYAFLPVLVAVPFAVGFTMLSQIYYFQAIDINLQLRGADAFVKEINNFHELIWLVMTIVVIWGGVFAMLKKGKFAESTVAAIQNVGQRGAKTAGLLSLAGIQAPVPGGNLLSAFEQTRYALSPEAIRFKARSGQPIFGDNKEAPPADLQKLAREKGSEKQINENIQIKIVQAANSGNVDEIRKQINDYDSTLATAITSTAGLAAALRGLQESLPSGSTLGKLDVSTLESNKTFQQNAEASFAGGGSTPTRFSLNLGSDWNNTVKGETIDTLKKANVTVSELRDVIEKEIRESNNELMKDDLKKMLREITPDMTIDQARDALEKNR